MNHTPNAVDSQRTHCRLAKNAPAMQIVPDGSGKLRLGTLIRLPDGAEVEVCGEGYNDRTTKVIWEGSTYYVFSNDLWVDRPALAALGAS